MSSVLTCVITLVRAALVSLWFCLLLFLLLRSSRLLGTGLDS